MPTKTTHTVNYSTDEIKKFESFAERWWDPNSEFKPLHDINPLRLRFITDKISLSGQQVIDIGCGGGILAESMAKQGATVTAVDLGETAIKVAKQHAKQSKLSIDYQITTAEAIAQQQAGQFDVVTCMEMLEHVPNPQSVIQACSSLCKPNGKLFFSTINRNLKSYMFAIVGAEYILNLLPKGTHQYKDFIRPSELDHWARQAGLKLMNLLGMSYSPLNKEYYLTDDISVNYLAYLQKKTN